MDIEDTCEHQFCLDVNSLDKSQNKIKIKLGSNKYKSSGLYIILFRFLVLR